ncbi:hypothetical protein [Flagellimonas pacifica]|uniref:Uncharacterized protein n=1 Tax=Flagellimonas pacifica TaxID=1247520 RepID=A0A285MUW3_9FLAO|nr:hypothetical protein [Allomuricauda parva]SNZ00972.1 hypothetical protein SAMN06265377_2802 [Allomuricauda parva]
MERFKKTLSSKVVQNQNFENSTPKGSGTMILCKNNSQLCNDLGSIFENNDSEALKNAIDKIKKDINSKPSLTIEEASETIKGEDVIADIYYGDKLIAENIPVSEQNPALIYLPYNGGKIENDLIRITQKSTSEADSESELISSNLILNKPTLSLVEQDALSQIPDDFDARNLGGAAICYAATLVALAYTVIAACSACNEDNIPTDLIRFKDEEITNWGPQLSAKKILEKRRDLLNGRLAGSF